MKNQVVVPFDWIRDIPELYKLLDGFTKGDILLTAEKWSGKPTQEQRGYWFAGIVGDVAERLGYDKDDLYLLLLQELSIKEIINKKTGTIAICKGVGLSHLNKLETSQVTDRAIRWFAERSIYVESPEDYFNRINQLGENQ